MKRVAVSVELNTPTTVLGYVREVGESKWVAEGDPGNQRFDTPREAAEHGHAILWRPIRKLTTRVDPTPEQIEEVRAAGTTIPGRRTSTATIADIRESAAIWRARAGELFGDPLAVDDFNHAVQCAERFDEQLREAAATCGE